MSLSAVPIGGGRIIPTVIAPSSDRSSSRFAVFLQVSTKFSHGVPLPRVAWGCLVVVTRMQAGNSVEYRLQEYY